MQDATAECSRVNFKERPNIQTCSMIKYVALVKEIYLSVIYIYGSRGKV